MAKKNVDKADMINVLRDNYMIYARSTIVERSLPFIDGYKPVQRRALYAMWELGLDKVSAKSARVVGDTMGKYHPHGDCEKSNTLLYLTNGTTITLGEAYEKQEDLEILAVDISTKKIVPAIAKAFRIGQYTNKIYHIYLSNGGEVECTNNHPFLLSNMNYKKAEDLIPGEVLYSQSFNNDARPKIGYRYIQDVLGEYYLGELYEQSDIEKKVQLKKSYHINSDNFSNVHIKNVLAKMNQLDLLNENVYDIYINFLKKLNYTKDLDRKSVV